MLLLVEGDETKWLQKTVAREFPLRTRGFTDTVCTGGLSGLFQRGSLSNGAGSARPASAGVSTVAQGLSAGEHLQWRYLFSYL